MEFPSTGALNNFQAGLRYTTTIGQADIGAQYFYGHLFRPNITINGIDNFLGDLAQEIVAENFTYSGNPGLISPQIKFTRYHQFGVDYAQVLFGFNLRSELALFLTEDFSGDDGSLQNPFIGWSLGFDRDIVWGINLNIQCNENIRLFNNKVGDSPVLDSEAGTNITSTRITLQFSKKFLKDNLESKATVLWGIEDSDCYIIPALVWTQDNLRTELSAGIFAGEKSGELGYFWENNFIKLGLKYLF
jgi:hypothetical protein